MSSRKEREELFRLLEEKEKRQQTCPIANIEWNKGGQAEAAGLINIYDIVIFTAGNRSGKSFWLVAHIIAYLLGYYPWKVPGFKLVLDNEGKWQFPHQRDIDSKYWVYRNDGLPLSTPSKVQFTTGLPLDRGTRILEEVFRKLWPKDVEFKYYLGSMGTWSRVEYRGSILTIGADTQRTQTFEGANNDLAAFDEPVRKQIFTAIRRGLIDRCGRVIWSLTPLGDARVGWLARDYIMTDDNEEKPEDAVVVYGNAYDNRHISKEQLDKFLNDPTLSKEEREARKSGKFGTLGRRIISTLEPSKTFIDPVPIPFDVPRMLIVDPHHSKPTCMAWFALMDAEHFIVYREWPMEKFHTIGIPKLDMASLAAKIKELEGKEQEVYRYCDPSFGVQHAKVLGEQFKSFQEEMSEYGLYFDTRVDNDVDRGISALRDAFRPSHSTGRPRVQIFKTCKNVRDAVSLWSYEDTPSGELKVSEKFKDFADVVRYGVMAGPSVAMQPYGTHSYLPDDEED